MKLRIFAKNIGSDNISIAYDDYTYDSYEIVEQMLIIRHTDLGTTMVPLINIKSIKEIDDETN